jgi:biotin carboxyl carrier protein
VNSKETPQNEKENKLGKLLEKYKIKVSNKEFMIELYNHDTSDDIFKVYSVLVNGKEYSVEVETLPNEAEADIHDTSVGSGTQKIAKPVLRSPAKPGQLLGSGSVPQRKNAPVAQPIDHAEPTSSNAGEKRKNVEGKTLTAPMPGKILDIKVNIGDSVESGQPLVILEAMKMENVMTAPASGEVKEIPIKQGINVNQGDILVVIE